MKMKLILATCCFSLANTSVGCTHGVPSLDPGEVLAVRLCDSDGTCSGTGDPAKGVADGQSPLLVHVWTPQTEDRRTSIPVNLTASDGYFEGPDKSPTAEVNIGRGGEAWLNLIPGTKTGRLTVQASFSDIAVTAAAELEPAPIGTVQVVPTPVVVGSAETATLELKVCVLGVAGAKPSAGTRLSFQVTSANAPTQQAYVYPAESVIDETCGARPFLVVLPGVDDIELTVTARPPLYREQDGDPVSVTTPILRSPPVVAADSDGGSL